MAEIKGMKEIILLPRRGGKTHNLVELVKANNGVLIVMSEMERHQIINQYGLMESQVMSWHNRDAFKGKWINMPFYLDNLDILLLQLFKVNIEAVSITVGEDTKLITSKYRGV